MNVTLECYRLREKMMSFQDVILIPAYTFQEIEIWDVLHLV